MQVNPISSELSITQQRIVAQNSAINDALIRISATQKIDKASSDAINALLGAGANTEAQFMERAYMNALDSASMLSTASSTSEQASELLIQAEELAIRASSASLSNEDRALVEASYNSTIDALDSLIQGATFNGKALFGESFSFFLGTSPSDTLMVNLGDISADSLGLRSINLSSVENAQSALTTINNGLDAVIEQQGAIASAQSTLESRATHLSQELFNTSTLQLRVDSPDSLTAFVDTTKSLITQDSATAFLVHNQNNLSAFLTSIS